LRILTGKVRPKGMKAVTQMFATAQHLTFTSAVNIDF